MRTSIILTELYPGDGAYAEHVKMLEENKYYSRVHKHNLPDGNEETIFISIVSSQNKAVDEAERILKGVH